MDLAVPSGHLTVCYGKPPFLHNIISRHILDRWDLFFPIASCYTLAESLSKICRRVRSCWRNTVSLKLLLGPCSWRGWRFAHLGRYQGCTPIYNSQCRHGNINYDATFTGDVATVLGMVRMSMPGH